MATTIKAKDRSDLRKSHTRRLRKNGFVPAVVYGKNKEPVTVAVNSIELIKNVREEGRNAVFSLDVEGKDSLNVLLYDYQTDDIKDELLHADFYQVDMSSEVDVEVNVQVEGKAKGEADGGIKQQTLYTVNVRTTPDSIPDVITVDISDLGIGDSLTVGDLKASNNYKILDDEASTIVTIIAPQIAGDDDSDPEAGPEDIPEATEAPEAEDN